MVFLLALFAMYFDWETSLRYTSSDFYVTQTVSEKQPFPQHPIHSPPFYI